MGWVISHDPQKYSFFKLILKSPYESCCDASRFAKHVGLEILGVGLIQPDVCSKNRFSVFFGHSPTKTGFNRF